MKNFLGCNALKDLSLLSLKYIAYFLVKQLIKDNRLLLIYFQFFSRIGNSNHSGVTYFMRLLCGNLLLMSVLILFFANSHQEEFSVLYKFTDR